MDYLKKMRAKLNQLKEQKKNQGKKFIKIERDSSIKVRFIPYKKDDDGYPVHFLERVQHYMGSGGVIGCAQMMGDQPCAICEWIQEHSMDMDERNIALLRKFRASFNYVSNVLQVEGGVIGKEPQILSITSPTYMDIMKLFELDGWANVLDPFKGNCILIRSESIGAGKMNVRYKPTPDPEAKGPIAPTKDEVVAILNTTYNLDKIFRVWPDYDAQKECLTKALEDQALKAEALAEYQAFKRTRGGK